MAQEHRLPQPLDDRVLDLVVGGYPASSAGIPVAMNVDGTGSALEEELDPLSEILKAVNSQHSADTLDSAFSTYSAALDRFLKNLTE